MVVAAGVLGNLVGSWIAYGLGRRYGRALLDRYGKYVLIRSHDIDKAEIWWEKYGDAATFFSRMLPVDPYIHLGSRRHRPDAVRQVHPLHVPRRDPVDLRT